MNYNEIIEKIIETIKIWFILLVKFNPEPKFLSDVAAVEAVVIAIAIPLSFEIISRISERYQSEVISNRFAQSWPVIWLPRFLISNIILAVSLRFFINDTPSSGLWKCSAWITFAGFLLIAVTFWKFILRLKHYMTDTRFTLKELYNEAENFFE